MKKLSKNYVFSIFSIILCTYSVFSILATISYALDTISPTQSLSDGQTIVSSDGTFVLGFFSPSGTGSSNRYIAIWYKKSNGTVVWIGNRDNPLTVTAGGGVLKLTDEGFLILVNSTNAIFWSSMNSLSSNSSVVNPVAQLLDCGNLVVRDANDGNLLWQSFDHPTDTMLPGMKLGKDFVTGIERHLWAWKSSDDPSTSDYNFGFDLRGYPQLVLSNGADWIARAGPWNGRRFSGFYAMKPNAIFTFYFVFTQREVYYEYHLLNSAVYSRLVLNENGIVQRLTWNNITADWKSYLNAPGDNCDNYGWCHGNGNCNISASSICGCLDKFVPKNPLDWEKEVWSGGCVRRTPLNCHNESSNVFIKYSGIKLPDTRYSWFNETMTLQECKEVCSKNCTCMAYANINITSGGSGCLLWFDDLIDIRVILPEIGQDIYIRMASSESVSEAGSQSTGKRRKTLIVSIALLAGVFGLCLTLALYTWKKKHRKQKLKRERFESGMDQGNTSESNKEDLELPMFNLLTIANATDNFSTGNKLGEGGFGPVYKGVLEEGREIAVKRLSKYSAQGGDEFKNEVICIAKLQHRNLVKLLGCCFQGEEKMLIYEYMPNKSLDLFIFDENQSKLLDWPKRFDIINGIARGLLYLHQDSRLRIIHRDLKASNILLDANMIPKISDFGVARRFAENETGATTNRVVGTHGYMSPEYAVDGVFSVKSDVFSFGVLVLEIVTGKRNRGFDHPDHHLNLLGHSWNLFMEGRSLELVDTPVEEASCYLSQVLRSIHIALLCVQQAPKDRPNMSSVILMSGSEGALLQPKQPGFYTERSFPQIDYSSSSNQTRSSVNEITMTELVAR